MPEDLRTFFERIEAAFCRRRGAPLLLSPLDFEKVVEWFAAGIPAEVVEEGIAEYFKKLENRQIPLKRAICLSFAEDQVLKAREAQRAAAVGRRAGVEPHPQESARVAAFLTRCASALRRFSHDGARRGALPVLVRFAASTAGEVEALIPSSSRPLAKLEAVLGPLDQELGRLVLLESPEAMVGAWMAEAEARLGDLACSLEEQALRQTVERLARQAGLAHYGLPRLSLLYME
jgi:hypothetical protein